MEERIPVGFIEARVRFPVYEGDALGPERTYDWFIYEEPGVTPAGELGACRRTCILLEARLVQFKEG